MIAPVTPRPAATIMLLRDSPTDIGERLEVLLLRRSGRTPFVPGAHVFPGGAVDPGDHDPRLVTLAEGHDDVTASATLDVDAGGLAFWVAAVRESLEEAGVLLADDADGQPVDGTHPALADLDRLRRRIEDGEDTLGRLYAEHGLRLPAGRIRYVSRWITPEESPRRYDTRFFAAAMPPGQTAVADDWEAVDASWWHPADALSGWQAGDIDLIEPTVVSLQFLAEFDSTENALSAIRGADR